MVSSADKRHVARDPSGNSFHDSPNRAERAPRIASAGLVFPAITSVGWGLNWPIMKQILTE